MPVESALLHSTSRDDLDELRSLWNDGRVMRWVEFPEGLGIDETEMESWFVALQGNPDSHHFVIRDEALGFCGEVYYRADRSRRWASLDIKLTPEAQGRGLATEALRDLIDLVFEAEDEVDVVWTEPSAENLSAQRLYERCGLIPEPRPAFLDDGPSVWVRRRTG